VDRTSIDIGDGASLELVDMFCYLGDMLSIDGDVMQLWRLEYVMDGISLDNSCLCLPITTSQLL